MGNSVFLNDATGTRAKKKKKKLVHSNNVNRETHSNNVKTERQSN